ncbi:hypothetical protein BGZ74_005602 [Mortierella antarctica]|nr:hypothetical protein BGZ74_005602 [Mortierella antarctica]
MRVHEPRILQHLLYAMKFSLSVTLVLLAVAVSSAQAEYDKNRFFRCIRDGSDHAYCKKFCEIKK